MASPHGAAFSLGAAYNLTTSSGQGLHEVKLCRESFRGPQRAFIAHTAGVFNAMRTSLKEEGAQGKAIISKMSKLYRSAISQLTESTFEGGEGDVFRLTEVVWHLCEILLIDTQLPGVLTQQLQHWSASTSSVTEEKLSTLEEGVAEEHFWDTLFTLILHGQIEDARFILRSHRLWAREDFAIMSKLLESMPVMGQEPVGQFQFLTDWKEWQDTVLQILYEERFGEDTRFRSACLLLTGDEGEFSRHHHLFDSWYHLMVAKMAYTKPLSTISDLQKLAEDAVSSEDFTSNDLLSQIVLSLFRLDLQSVTRQLAEVDDNWWLSTHLIDLLCLGGQLHQYGVHHIEEMHRQLLIDYATCLMACPPLWEVGLLYLSECPESSAMISEALMSVHCTSQGKALKVVAMANSMGLKETATALCRVQSVKWIKEGKLESALCWAMRSRNAPLVSRISESILQTLLDTGTLCCEDLLDGLGNGILISERLTFLAKYNDFLRLRQDTPQKACQLLLNLIDSQLAPKFFWGHLLKDAVELLEMEDVQVLELAHLQQLMATLQEVVRTRSGDLTQKTEQKLRFACAQKMSQSLLSLMQGSGGNDTLF